MTKKPKTSIRPRAPKVKTPRVKPAPPKVRAPRVGP